MHFVPLEPGEGGIANQEKKSDHLSAKLNVIKPVSFGGTILCFCLGMVENQIGTRLRDLWPGLAAIFVGCPVASLGLAIFLIRVA